MTKQGWRRGRSLLRAGIVACVLLLGPIVSSAQSDPSPANFKIAFIGDQGSQGDEKARQVLELIASEGAHVVVHSGDFDYDDNPAAWDALISQVLGENFPYFASVGNHDDDDFYGPGGYQDFLEARMNRVGIPWNGDLGVKSVHEYEGFLFILTAPDIFADGNGDAVFAPYIHDQLAPSDAIWRISSWHKNMTKMQVGGKSNDTGWGVYEESRRGGAIIATGHEHTYSRTGLLSDISTQTCVYAPGCSSPDNTLVLDADDPLTTTDEGATFVFVSGLGGKSVRDQEELPTAPWWESVYTENQGATFGALFGEFNIEGDLRMARFYFMDIGPDGVVSGDDRTIDEFNVRSNVGVDPEPEVLPVTNWLMMFITALLIIAFTLMRRFMAPTVASSSPRESS